MFLLIFFDCLEAAFDLLFYGYGLEHHVAKNIVVVRNIALNHRFHNCRVVCCLGGKRWLQARFRLLFSQLRVSLFTALLGGGSNILKMSP